MKKHQRHVWLVAGSLLLAACGGVAAPPDAAGTEQPVCDFSAPMTPEAGERVRAWVLFRVEDPHGAAARFGELDEKGLTLLTEGSNDYVIVRADVVEGDPNYNLVVPVDAASAEEFQVALGRLKSVVGEEVPTTVLNVVEHFPTPPQRSHTYVTEKELTQCFLPEYNPSGRHPQSPGANPWG